MEKGELYKYIFANYQSKSITDLARDIMSMPNCGYSLDKLDSLRKRISYIVNKEKSSEQDSEPTEIVPLKLKKSKYYIITWEQNNSILHKELWKNILAYKEYLGAEVAVILGTYHGRGIKKEDIKWNTETQQYWDFTRHDIHKYVNILSDINVQPTAALPLSGLEGVSRDKTSILGHPKRQWRCLPVLEGTPHKSLVTTMAISKPNYTATKAGKRAEFTHKYGFTIVEIRDNDIFHIRQVEANAEDGSFIDLFHEVSEGIVSKNHFAKAVVWGDVHLGHTDRNVVDKTFELIDKLNIPTSVLHDLADGESVNNHIVNNPIAQVRRADVEKDDVLSEISEVAKFIETLPTQENIVVNSNHDNRFDRWIISQDWKKDIKNAKAYLWLADIALNSDNDKGILANILENWDSIKGKVKCLSLIDSHRIGGIECGNHGHIGVSGSRGSLVQFKFMNIPTITGHSHSPGVMDDAYSVGTSTNLRLGYNVGGSDWMQGHCLIHKNNKVQHIIFSKGEYSTMT